MKIKHINFARLSCVLLIFLFLCKGVEAKKTPVVKKEEKKPLTQFEKLFKDKVFKTQKGLITLHKIQDKVYFQIPLSLMEKDLILNSAVEKVSDMEVAFIGQRSSITSWVSFAKKDSSIILRLSEYNVTTDFSDAGISKALDKSSIKPAIMMANISAYAADSQSVIVDMTSFFLGGSKHVINMNRAGSGMVSYQAGFKKETSCLVDIEAFNNHVSVLSDMSFGMSSSIMGFGGSEVPFTATIRTSIGLLPEVPMMSRTADPRVGTSITTLSQYSANEQKSKEIHYANKWRIEPTDSAAWRNGELVNPTKPIVFYIDSLFPLEWAKAIKAGVESWNSAFEEIGFKNVITTLPYPSNDSSFSANNSHYNCIKFTQTKGRSITKSLQTDPRTGEIFNANMYFSREMPEVIQRDRLIQTAAADPDVRSNKLPDKLMEETLTTLFTRETGICLGLSYNLAGSHTYPTDSLRSASFTRLNGLSATIMDQVLFNYVAQPGDKERGVAMIHKGLGLYDKYAISWLYKPLFLKTGSVEEIATLDKWIRDKADNPLYKFGTRPAAYALTFDPRFIANDLGNDVIKSTDYSLKNLKYVVDNSAAWVNQPGTEESYKELFIDFLFLRLYEQITQMSYFLGGIYLEENFGVNLKSTYTSLSRERQHEIIKYWLKICDDMTWLDNKELLYMGGPNGNMSAFSESNSFKLMFNRFTAVALSSSKTDKPYAVKDLMNDITDFVLVKVKTGTEINRSRKFMLDYLVLYLTQFVEKSSISSSSAANSESINDLNLDLDTGVDYSENSGFIPMTTVKYFLAPNNIEVFCMTLQKIRSALVSGVALAKDKTLKDHYKYTIRLIDKALK